MTTVTLASSKPPITLTSARGITITIDRSVSTSSGGGSGTVTSVTGSAPVVITGTVTVTPNVTITAVSTVAEGVMSSADKVKLDGIGTGATVTGVTGTAPIASSGGAAPVISIAAASTSAAGSLSAADKTKLDGITAAAVPAFQAVIQTLTVSGTIAETLPAYSIFTSVSGPATGVLLLNGIWLAKGTICTSISFHSSTTAAATPTNQWFVLADLNRVSLANTTNDTTTAWPASTTKTLALTAPFTTTYSGLHYIGVCVTATTIPTFRGLSYSTMTPIKLQSFFSTTGLTTPPAVPTTFAAYTANASTVLGGIS